MIKKRMGDCEKVFLDTSIIIDLLNAKESNEKTFFVKNLINSLCENKTNSKKERVFFISTITIGELVKFADKGKNDVIIDLMKLLNSSNLEVVPYTDDIALNQNILFKDYLTKTNLNKLIEQLKLFPHNYVLAREYITRDFMIITTAHHKNVDVILTSDKNSFLPIAEILNIYCKVAESSNFITSGNGLTVFDFK